MLRRQFPYNFSREALEKSDASQQKLSTERLVELRCQTIDWLVNFAQRLRYPQRVIATACIYFHAFYVKHLYLDHNRFEVAAACLVLSGKAEEVVLKLADLVFEFWVERHPEVPRIDINDPIINQYRQSILEKEGLLVAAVDFTFTIRHAHDCLLPALRFICEEFSQSIYDSLIQQVAWTAW
jgi:hypothetical protein